MTSCFSFLSWFSLSFSFSSPFALSNFLSFSLPLSDPHPPSSLSLFQCWDCFLLKEPRHPKLFMFGGRKEITSITKVFLFLSPWAFPPPSLFFSFISLRKMPQLSFPPPLSLSPFLCFPWYTFFGDSPPHCPSLLSPPPPLSCPPISFSAMSLEVSNAMLFDILSIGIYISLFL